MLAHSQICVVQFALHRPGTESNPHRGQTVYMHRDLHIRHAIDWFAVKFYGVVSSINGCDFNIMEHHSPPSLHGLRDPAEYVHGAG